MKNKRILSAVHSKSSPKYKNKKIKEINIKRCLKLLLTVQKLRYLRLPWVVFSTCLIGVLFVAVWVDWWTSSLLRSLWSNSTWNRKCFIEDNWFVKTFRNLIKNFQASRLSQRVTFTFFPKAQSRTELPSKVISRTELHFPFACIEKFVFAWNINNPSAFAFVFATWCCVS